jgi:DNA-binding LacI/PurR family transcriptional regulator
MVEKIVVSRAIEVAERAGVSRSAVSRAFNPSAYLDGAKRERILEISKELGYHPNMAARAMASNRSHLIAVLVSALRQPWESQELDVLTGELQKIGFATLVYNIPSATPWLDQISHLRAYNPDSIIVYSDYLQLEGIESLFSRSRPIFPVYANDSTDQSTRITNNDAGYDQLVIDQRPGIKHAVRLLASCGCKTLGWISGEENTNSNRDRQDVVLKYAKQFGLKVSATIPGDFSYGRAREEVRAYFRAHPMVDALFAANDVSAFGAMDALRHDLGYSIPEDIKVVGFDNVSQANWKSYDLTTVGMDIQERVRALVRLIQNRLENPKGPDLFESVETKLILRGTVT